LTKDEKQADQLIADWHEAQLTGRQRAMLEYADKLTRTPGKMEKGDVDQMIAAGLSERDVLDVNQISGYFAYVNRLADGLGVPLEAFWEETTSRHEPE
jgi:uncharacterized peroxidase-related enzyme